MRSSLFTAAAALVVAQLAAAQTFTDCDPTKKTCPTEAALGTSISVDFTKGESDHFTLLPGTTLKYGSEGAEFIIEKESNAPTIKSQWDIFYGTVEVVMKAAPGQGIVSSFVLESSDLDEVDWEWIGSDTAQVQSNYYGKGNVTTYDRGAYHPIASPQSSFHTYSIDWTPEYLAWSIDGAEIRRLLRGDANGGQNYPQTPMKVKLGNWVGGGSTSAKGTVEWAGGLADFTQAPFTMVVKSLKITDGHPGAKTYTYGDLTGSDTSIVVDAESSGAVFQEEGSSSSSSKAEATSTKASSSSSKAASSSVAVSTTSVAASTTLKVSTSVKASSTAVSSASSVGGSKNATITATGTSQSDGAAATTSGPATVPTGAASIAGANFAMLVAAAALSFFAL